MINGALEVGFLLLQRQISLSVIRALLSIMVTYDAILNQAVMLLSLEIIGEAENCETDLLVMQLDSPSTPETDIL